MFCGQRDLITGRSLERGVDKFPVFFNLNKLKLIEAFEEKLLNNLLLKAEMELPRSFRLFLII